MALLGQLVLEQQEPLGQSEQVGQAAHLAHLAHLGLLALEQVEQLELQAQWDQLALLGHLVGRKEPLALLAL